MLSKVILITMKVVVCLFQEAKYKACLSKRVCLQRETKKCGNRNCKKEFSTQCNVLGSK